MGRLNLLHFFAGFRRSSIVKQFFHQNAQTSTNKKNVGPVTKSRRHVEYINDMDDDVEICIEDLDYDMDTGVIS